MPKSLQNFLVLSLTLLLTLGVIEVLLRVFMPIDYRAPPSELRHVARESIYRSSSTPGLAYELVPDIVAPAHYAGELVTTNSFGMRDEEPDPARDNRIVILGDSFAFGFGVTQDAIFPIQLEHRLNADQLVYEVLNLAVAGYGIREEVAVLEHKGMLWEPDVVVVAYVLNDPEIEPVQQLPSYFSEPKWWQYSHVLRLVARGVKRIGVIVVGGGDYFRYLHANQQTWKQVVAGFEAIREITASADARVIVLIFPIIGSDWSNYPYRDIHQKVGALAIENGFQVVDLLDYYGTYSPEELKVSADDGHPNALAHALAAQAVLETLR